MTERESRLRDEARHLYAALFAAAPPEDIVESYLRAHQFYCDPASDEIDFPLLVSRKLDVEALELVLRKRHPALTRKLRILLYLAEVQPSYYPRFVNQSSRRLLAWLSLAGATLRTVGKRLKGHLLLRRHPVV